MNFVVDMNLVCFNCEPGMFRRKIGARVVSLLNQYASHLKTGALVSVNELAERVRILPLK